MDQETESGLVARAQRGDRAAYDALAGDARDRVRGSVRKMIGHPDDTEDVVQDALLKGWSAISGFNGRSRFATWLTSIALRAAVDHLRGQKRWRTEAQVAYGNVCAETEEYRSEVGAAFSAADFSFEVREHIAYCFTCVGRSLPPDEQAALVVTDVLGMANREAGTVLGVSESVLRHRLSAARQSMKDKYEGLCALVNKQGICHQCKGLRESAAAARRGGPIPDIANFADRCAVVRGQGDGNGGMRGLHDLFWRRTKEIEESGAGSTEPLSDCGRD